MDYFVVSELLVVSSITKRWKVVSGSLKICLPYVYLEDLQQNPH